MVSFWRHRAEDILNKYAPLLQACCSVFPRKLPEDLLNRDGELTVVLIFDICNVHEIVAYDWLHSQHWGGEGGGKDVKYGFETSLKHRRLVFVFRRLVRLIWFCETVELIKSVLSIFNDIWMIFAVMYGGKPHAQECIFQQFNLPKSNPFFIV